MLLTSPKLAVFWPLSLQWLFYPAKERLVTVEKVGRKAFGRPAKCLASYVSMSFLKTMKIGKCVGSHFAIFIDVASLDPGSQIV